MIYNYGVILFIFSRTTGIKSTSVSDSTTAVAASAAVCSTTTTTAATTTATTASSNHNNNNNNNNNNAQEQTKTTKANSITTTTQASSQHVSLSTPINNSLNTTSTAGSLTSALQQSHRSIITSSQMKCKLLFTFSERLENKVPLNFDRFFSLLLCQSQVSMMISQNSHWSHHQHK